LLVFQQLRSRIGRDYEKKAAFQFAKRGWGFTVEHSQ